MPFVGNAARLRLLLLGMIFAVCASSDSRAQVGEVNLSTDLTRLGIAAQNMEPDRRDLDSRPLFGAALEYVKSRRIPRVTLNRGSYYFLTPRQGMEGYVLTADLQDVTFDFNGANIYFRDALVPAFNLFNARRVTLQRFTLDYISLPFTQARITGIGVIGNRIEDSIRPYSDADIGTANALGGMAVTQFQIPPGGTIPVVRSNQQIRFIGNIISGSGRSGIFVSNASGVTIQDNVIARSGLFASAPMFGFAGSIQPQLVAEFAKDIGVINSDGVNVNGGAAPGPPSSLAAAVSGSTVTLQWIGPATGTPPVSYIIEAGSAPGLANLAAFSTGSTATSFTTSGVPPGTYHVRIRAAGAGGAGPASNEVVVVVN